MKDLVEFEKKSKRLGLVLHDLYMRARDKKKAARIRRMLAEGKISYDEALERLRALVDEG